MIEFEEDRNDIEFDSQNNINADENGANNSNRGHISDAGAEISKDKNEEVSDESIEYAYGISYSSSGFNEVKDKKADTRKSRSDNRSRRHSRLKKTAIIAAMLVLVLALNVLSAFIAVSLTQKYMSEDGEEKNLTADTGNRPTVNFYKSELDISKIETVEDSAGGRTWSKKDVYALVSDSVVEIKTETVVSGSMIGQYVTSGAGSGVIIGNIENTKSYYILTNDHVVSGASKVTVRLTDGTEYNAKIVSTDSYSDIAVLLVDADKELKCAVIGDSDRLVVGEDVIAIGNPLGELGGSLTDGIISALERNVVIDGTPMKLLQTNVAVNPGNSGGGLFNMAGELIGIVNAKYSDYDIEGLAFAIPVKTASSVMTELIEYGYVKGRPDLGITVSERTQTYFGMVAETYVIVTDPGNNADIKANDQIYKVDDTEISTLANIKSALSGKSVGDKVTLTLFRNRAFIEVEVTLVEYTPSDTSIDFKPDI